MKEYGRGKHKDLYIIIFLIIGYSLAHIYENVFMKVFFDHCILM